MKDFNVLILLATYNGEAYIGQQLDSLMEQDYCNFRILVSDDGSADATVSILDHYASSHPDRIQHYRSGQRFGNAQKHFLHLLNQFHDADYIMFCDQDDVWHTDKVRNTLRFMQQIEVNPEIPALVHTDLRVVDGSLNVTAASFCRLCSLNGNRLSLNQLLVQNVVTGCTMMINRALAHLACRKTDMEAVLMHDGWLAMLASACGVTGFLDEATIDYRQHGTNSVGAKNVYSPSYLYQRLRSEKARHAMTDAALQARSFLETYSDVLKPEQTQMLSAFAATPGLSFWGRNRIYLKYNLLKSGVVRIFAQLMGF